MSSFTARVELHSANYSDYEKLHAEMAKQGFRRTITSDGGKRYALPTAEYDISGTLTTHDVLNRAKVAVNATGRTNGILVTKSDGRKWTGLQVV